MTLRNIAARDGMTVNQLIAKLYDEIVEARGEVPNLASFLRVSCMRYLTLVLGKEEAAPAPRPVLRREAEVVALRP